MFGKNKTRYHRLVDGIVRPPKQSHKKRNALIGLVGAAAAVVIAGAAAKESDSK